MNKLLNIIINMEYMKTVSFIDSENNIYIKSDLNVN